LLLQLLLGVARLVPAPAYFPLRLRCARALNRLGEATGTFIPVAPILLEVLQWSDLRRAPKPGPGQQPDVLLQLRVSKAAMRSSQYQEEIISQVCFGGRAGGGTVFGDAGSELGWDKQAHLCTGLYTTAQLHTRVCMVVSVPGLYVSFCYGCLCSSSGC